MLINDYHLTTYLILGVGSARFGQEGAVQERLMLYIKCCGYSNLLPELEESFVSEPASSRSGTLQDTGRYGTRTLDGLLCARGYVRI